MYEMGVVLVGSI